MTKPELGTKRLCASCGARFYDLLHSPITCPKCGTVLATPDVSSSRVRKATREPEREFERPVTETSGAQFAAPKDASGEADGEEEEAGVLPEADDDDDEDLDGAVLLEDSDEEDGDVADIRRKEED
jgi:uncharacterized protein (TIGR02300 family)